MATRQRRLSAAQARRDVMRQQWSFAGGMVSDRHPSSLGAGQVAELVNLRPDGDRLVAVRDAAAIGATTIAKTQTILASGMGRTDDIQSGGAAIAFWWVLATDGTTTCSLYTYKANGSALVGAINVTTWVGYGTGTTAVAFRDGVLLRSTAGLLVYVPIYGTYSAPNTTYTSLGVVRLNDPRPIAPITGPVANTGYNLTLSTGTSGTEVYRFNYTFAIKSGRTGQLLWESLPLKLTSADSTADVSVDTYSGGTTNFSALLTTHYIDFRYIDNLQVNAAGSDNYGLITTVRVWRTLNVGIDPATGVATGNRTDEFFLMHEATRTTEDYLTMALGTGGTAMADDTELVFQPRLSRNLTPMTAVGGPMCWHGGFLFSANGHVVEYSETEGEPQFAGYWYAGGPCQKTMHGPVTSIAGGDGYVLINTISSITRISTQATTEVANDAYPWMSRSALWSEGVVIDGEGVAGNDLIDQVPGGLVMVTTADSVRLYDGNLLQEPLDRNRVHDRIVGATSVSWVRYAPDGYLLLKTSTEFLRCDIAPGTPWAVFEPVTTFAGRPFRAFAADGPGGKTGLVSLYQGTTYWTAQIHAQDSASTDLPWSVTLPQYRGEWDGYAVIHRETILTASGTWTDASATLLTDANGVTEYGQRAALEETVSLDSAEMASISLRRTIQQLRYVQLEIAGADTTGAVLHRVQTTCEVQDRPWRAVEVLGGTYDRSLDLFGQGRGGWDGYAWNRGDVTGTPTSDWGTMDDATLDNDGHKWLGSVLGAGCWVDLTDVLETGALMVVSWWMRLSDLEALATWSPVIDMGSCSLFVGPGTTTGEYGLMLGGNKDTTGAVYSTATTDTDVWVSFVLQVKADLVRLDASGEVIDRAVLGSPSRIWVGRVGADTRATPAIFDLRVCRDSSTTYLTLAPMRTDWGQCLKRIDPAARIVEQ